MSNGNFQFHTACERCGSSDAKAIYSDGSSYCFSCKTVCPAKQYSSDQIRRDSSGIDKGVSKTSRACKALPEDCSNTYGKEAIEWVEKYGLSVQDMLRERMAYSQSQKQLFFCWYDSEGALLAWQSRNFQEGWPKYLSSGDFNRLLPIYKTNRDRIGQLVLTEDCLSAIKVRNVTEEALESPTIDAMPCLTSSLPISKLNRLAGLYDAFLVWLDSDMFDNAQKMVRQLQLMGRKARAIWTPEDPKCYDSVTILDFLGEHSV